MQTIIIIPCYNEAKRLPTESFLNFVLGNPDIMFLFVNDGSKDNTLSVLEDFTSKHPLLRYLDLEKNGGKAEAVRQGVLYAYEQFNPELIGFYDADMATPLFDLSAMLQQIELKKYYMITGCRIKRMGGDIERRYSRFLFGRIFATCAASILHLPVYDTQCGAKIIRSDVAKHIFSTPFVSKWLFDVELFARIIINYGYDEALSKIVEYPLSVWKDVGGSKLTIKDILVQPLNLLKIKFHYKLKKYVK